jgi:CO dehydrogenase nickel-insertion accessory protein CooC1
VLEGVDAVLVVAEPSHEAVRLAEKAVKLVREAKKTMEWCSTKWTARQSLL